MFDKRKTDTEIANLSALIGSIKANAEKIQSSENVAVLIKGITDMCEIAEVKLSVVRKDVNSEVSKDV